MELPVSTHSYDAVKRVQEEFFTAALSANGEAFDALLSNAFFCTTVSSNKMERAAFLDLFGSAKRRINKLSTRAMEIITFPGAGIVSCTLDLQAEMDGRKFEGIVQVTYVWVLLESKWKCACYHLSDFRKQQAWQGLLKQYPLRPSSLGAISSWIAV